VTKKVADAWKRPRSANTWRVVSGCGPSSKVSASRDLSAGPRRTTVPYQLRPGSAPKKAMRSRTARAPKSQLTIVAIEAERTPSANGAATALGSPSGSHTKPAIVCPMLSKRFGQAELTLLAVCLSGCNGASNVAISGLGGADSGGGGRNVGGNESSFASGGSAGNLGGSAGASNAANDCLKHVAADLLDYLAAAPYSGSAAMTMPIWETTSDKWQAARVAALAWANKDCASFATAARTMGYEAVRLEDAATGRNYWVLRDVSSQFQGVFAFRDPGELTGTRSLVIDSPHFGFDFRDDRAIRLFRDVNAVAFLQNTAHRCNVTSCSGCSEVQNYACDGTCMRDSDVVHAIRNGYFAVYDGLEAARDDLHLEYHGAGVSNNLPGCAGTVHISQASSMKLTPAEDDATYPNRFWTAMKKGVGDACACYHQRQTGCRLNGAASTAGRRTNQESSPADANLAVCTASPSALSARFVHMEAYNVDPALLLAALSEAVPAL